MSTATAFRIDPLQPTALLCECCGEPVCELPADSEVMEHAGGLTARQAAAVWPERWHTIKLHATLCEWWRTSPRADVPVYVQVREKERE